jgi:nucleoside-triphosphatase
MLSPVTFLASFFSSKALTGELVIITGERGAGKSTWCRRLVDQARLYGLNVDGLLSPAVFDAGQKVAIDLVAIGSRQRRRLAARRESAAASWPSGPRTEGWQFAGETLAWGNNLLRSLSPVDVLVLDELGPLEMLENQGLTAGLERIDRRADRLACVVVRPLLLGAAQERWPWSRVVEIPGGVKP